MNFGELANQWYIILSTANRAVAEPLMTLSNSLGVPIITALLLGLLGATSPCQVTTNASALAMISRRLDDAPRAPLLAALAYLVAMLGALGTREVLGRPAPQVSPAGQKGV